MDTINDARLQALQEADKLEVCGTCSNQYDPLNTRVTHPYRHPINGPVLNKPEEQQANEPGQLNLPSDPILRLVLIEKGLIAVTDLTEAEQKLAASGMAMTRGPEKGD